MPSTPPATATRRARRETGSSTPRANTSCPAWSRCTLTCPRLTATSVQRRSTLSTVSISVMESPQSAIDTVDKVERLRSEEHTSELQSLAYLVCRLLLEKKKHI